MAAASRRRGGGSADYTWPAGRRLAVYFALNLEHFSYGEGLGAELAPGGPHPDILNYAWRDYGNRVGVFRILRALKAGGLKATFPVNAALLSQKKHSSCSNAMFRWRSV